MTDQRSTRPPQSPEVEPAGVRDELDQYGMSHQGAERPAGDEAAGAQMGANELEVTPVRAPMRGPGNLVGRGAPGDSSDDGDAGIDPGDEITPG